MTRRNWYETRGVVKKIHQRSTRLGPCPMRPADVRALQRLLIERVTPKSLSVSATAGDTDLNAESVEDILGFEDLPDDLSYLSFHLRAEGRTDITVRLMGRSCKVEVEGEDRTFVIGKHQEFVDFLRRRERRESVRSRIAYWLLTVPLGVFIWNGYGAIQAGDTTWAVGFGVLTIACLAAGVIYLRSRFSATPVILPESSAGQPMQRDRLTLGISILGLITGVVQVIVALYK